MCNNNSERANDRIHHVIEELQGRSGMAQMYCNCIARLRKAVLFLSDDLGMSDNEALNTVRILELLHADLRVLSGTEISPIEDPADTSWPAVPEDLSAATPEEIRRNLDRAFACLSADPSPDQNAEPAGDDSENCNSRI